jgi:hypothetical protein
MTSGLDIRYDLGEGHRPNDFVVVVS